MTWKEAAETLLLWRTHIKNCRTCSHGIGYTCSRCFFGEDLEDAAEKAAKFIRSSNLKGTKREVSQKTRRR